MAELVARGEVDRGEILRVELGRSGGWRSWTSVPGETAAEVAGSDLDEILGHLADLPGGEQMRCFTPRLGLRLWAGDTLRAEAAISFQCNNALTFVDGRSGWFEFDATSRPGRMLRSVLERPGRNRRQPSDRLTPESISEAVAELASRIDAAEPLLPSYGCSDDPSRPHIELVGARAEYVTATGDRERSRRSTGSLDELLYWVFVDVTFRVSFRRMLSHPVDGEDPWRSVYAQQRELLGSLDESWSERYQDSRRARLDDLDI